jgi:hypothetical protein
MSTRRRSLVSCTLALACSLFAVPLLAEPPRLAGITTAYYHNSHADMILGRYLEGYMLESKPPYPTGKLASLYIEQFPTNDKGVRLAAEKKIPLFGTVREALTLGGDRLAVDGVLLVAEHGKYPESDTGSIIYPKRAMFAEIAKLCEAAEKPVPVFIDKHLADNWTDAKWIYDEAARLKMPLMAGSSLPGLWRHPPADTVRDTPLKEIAVLSYHRLDSYGIHALEVVQCLAERRRGGETGVKQVRTLRGEAVWKALDEGVVDLELIEKLRATFKDRPIPSDKKLSELIKDPSLFVIDYNDGLRASVLTLDQLYIDWTAAWRYEDGSVQATVFWAPEVRPMMHFSFLVQGLEPFLESGKPTWPVERTLLTTGMLDSLLISARDGGRLVETPHLAIEYESEWEWRQPPDPPPARPVDAQ